MGVVHTAPSTTARRTRSVPRFRQQLLQLLQRRNRKIKRWTDSHNRWTKEWGHVTPLLPISSSFMDRLMVDFRFARGRWECVQRVHNAKHIRPTLSQERHAF